jgi:hypothetical protein
VAEFGGGFSLVTADVKSGFVRVPAARLSSWSMPHRKHGCRMPCRERARSGAMGQVDITNRSLSCLWIPRAERCVPNCPRRPGRLFATAGIAALPLDVQVEIMRRVHTFAAFTPDIDPDGEHDFGRFDQSGKTIF